MTSLHIRFGYLDLGRVGVIEELFQYGRRDAVDGNHLLVGFCQPGSEHGLEVVADGRENAFVAGQLSIRAARPDYDIAEGLLLSEVVETLQELKLNMK